MNPQRKRIIISEIKYWKQNKLLPEHYCDFLITLYAQGEGDDAIVSKSKDAIFDKEKKKVNRTIIQLTLIAILVGGSMFVLAFIDVS
jgi:predicted nucleic acid-binding Zn ribbon protein